ncbi:MAG: amidinotransferase, partial [Calditrichaeota bacterium]|nr:amidinotransferase [Calditrichota bacterium]
SPLDTNLFLVYSRLLSVPFRELLLERNIQLIEVAEDEYDSMACNVLAIAPRVCIMLKGNPLTKKRMQDAGVTVYEYDGSEISLKGCGGPTCLTKPLWRTT